MSETFRAVSKVWPSVPTREGAGVHLRRAFGFDEVPALDPFLLLDDFRGDDPRQYRAGFPWHPHRGIETITYMLAGRVAHGDSMGNEGIIAPGDVQWMTAGSGIIHQEMPEGDEHGRMGGFQLWANLPRSHKMMAPRYQGITAEEIPTVTLDSGAQVRIVCGTVNGVSGPVSDIMTDPEYLDVAIPANSAFTHAIKHGHTAFAYVYEGAASFAPEASAPVGSEHLVLYEPEGDGVAVTTGEQAVRFILVSGQPLGEPVAWAGPIVMNTQEELRVAFEEYERGTFIKGG